jgi:hypothetical protein
MFERPTIYVGTLRGDETEEELQAKMEFWERWAVETKSHYCIDGNVSSLGVEYGCITAAGANYVPAPAGPGWTVIVRCDELVPAADLHLAQVVVVTGECPGGVNPVPALRARGVRGVWEPFGTGRTAMYVDIPRSEPRPRVPLTVIAGHGPAVEVVDSMLEVPFYRFDGVDFRTLERVVYDYKHKYVYDMTQSIHPRATSGTHLVYMWASGIDAPSPDVAEYISRFEQVQIIPASAANAPEHLCETLRTQTYIQVECGKFQKMT